MSAELLSADIGAHSGTPALADCPPIPEEHHCGTHGVSPIAAWWGGYGCPHRYSSMVVDQDSQRFAGIRTVRFTRRSRRLLLRLKAGVQDDGNTPIPMR